MYQNEKESAAAIRKSGLDRSQIFFTSKIPPAYMGYRMAKQAIEESMAAADIEYIDLCVSHIPIADCKKRGLIYLLVC